MNEHSFTNDLPMIALRKKKKADAAGQPDDKRARILEAALDLFEARGFDGVAVPEIAIRAGVATGTIYRYFTDKEALVNALYRQWKEAYNQVVLAPPPPGLPPHALFARYWHRMTLFARTYPRAVRFMDLHHHAPYLDAQSRAVAGAYAQTAQDFVIAARAAGAIRDLEPAMVVALMWGAAAGLAKFAQTDAITFDAKTAADMGEALWRAIAADRSSQPAS